MIDFKDGAFTIAIQTQTPILPMLYIHTDDLMPNNKPLMRPGIIDVYYLDPISVEGLTDADIPILKQQTRDMMMAKYLSLKGA
jgi:1-acyl-sn-glycerol-3-phosphate acyltransferase